MLMSQIKLLLYSLIIFSGVTSERCPSPRLCARAHTSTLQRWRFIGNVWEIWSARNLTPYLLHQKQTSVC